MPKIVDHQQKRNEIAAAACQTIAEYGLAASSMRMIARAANCSTGTITHYFPDKNALLVAAIDYSADQQITATEILATESPQDLVGNLRNLLPVNDVNRLTAKMFLAFWNRSSNSVQINQLQYGLHKRYQQLVTKLLRKAGSSSDAKITDDTECILTFINGMTIRAVIEPENWPPKKQTAALRKYISLQIAHTTNPSQTMPAKA
ncbi:MAG: TetR/AcrR family transcriptional regulator [Thiolinea sp.]